MKRQRSEVWRGDGQGLPGAFTACYSKCAGLNFIAWIKLSSQRLKLMSFYWSKRECAVVGLMVKVFNADPGKQIAKLW